MRKILIVCAILVGALIVGIAVKRSRGTNASLSFRTVAVARGDIVSVVSSTGTVNPVTSVKVGAEVSGKIKELHVDFNSEVKEGQLVARIDPETFEAKVSQARAELKIARANVEIREAAVEKAKAELANSRSELASVRAQKEKARVASVDAKSELVRKKALHESQAIPIRQFEQVQALYDQSVAQLNSAEAEELSRQSLVKSRTAQLAMDIAQLAYAKAQVEHREAALKDAEIELGYTYIRSPVNGVVISREVDLGQTVVSRLQAPLLFTIAQDVRKMQVETNVDEADIGRVAPGQEATFTVDAFPGRTYKGSIDQIRKAPHQVQNVVTYTVIVAADNEDQSLLPGMTATVRIVAQNLKGVLRIPNAALRFHPPDSGDSKGDGPGPSDATGEGQSSSPQERIKRMIKALDMNKDQQDKTWALFEEVKRRVITAKSQGVSAQQMSSIRESERERMRKAIEEMLTPEQREKQKRLLSDIRLRNKTRGRVWRLDGAGRPAPLDVVTGITDGAYCQLVSGKLSEGDEVIVGTKRERH